MEERDSEILKWESIARAADNQVVPFDWGMCMTREAI